MNGGGEVGAVCQALLAWAAGAPVRMKLMAIEIRLCSRWCSDWEETEVAERGLVAEMPNSSTAQHSQQAQAPPALSADSGQCFTQPATLDLTHTCNSR